MTTLESQIGQLQPGMVGVLGVPFDENSSFLRGPAQAPEHIRRVLQRAYRVHASQSLVCDNVIRRSALMTNQPTYQGRIIVDPNILAGKPVIKGTRIPVELVLKRLAQDLDMQTIFAAYPSLTKEDVKACIAYAQALVEGEEVFPETAPVRAAN